MVKVGFEGDNTDSGDFPDPIRYDLGHERRHTGTIANVTDIYEKNDQFAEEDDATVEELRIEFRTPIDELDVDEDTADQLAEYVEQEIQSREDDGYDVDHPEDGVEVVMFPTAKVTPGTNDVNASKLFNTLRKLGLAESDESGVVTLYNRDGEVVHPFSDLDDPTAEEENEAFSQYLKDNLIGMEVTYELRNAKRGSDDEYSVVNKVISKDNDPVAE